MEPNVCTVTTSLLDILEDTEVSNASLIVILPVAFFYGTYLVQPSEKVQAFDSSGNCSITLIETTSYPPVSPYQFLLQYTADSGAVLTVELGTGTVPNTSTAALSSFLTIGFPPA